MPTIVIGSTKGGCGKTTLSLILASELSDAGASVTILDADKEGSLSNWGRDWEGTAPITIKGQITEDTVMDDIVEAAAQSTFVIVDIEGTANMTLTKAATMADLVLIPQKASALDWERTSKTVKGITDAGRMASKDIPFRVVITRTSQVARSKPMLSIIESLRAKVPTMKQELYDLEAFRSMFLYRQTLPELEQEKVVKTTTARLVAKDLLSEVIEILQEARNVENA